MIHSANQKRYSTRSFTKNPNCEKTYTAAAVTTIGKRWTSLLADTCPSKIINGLTGSSGSMLYRLKLLARVSGNGEKGILIAWTIEEGHSREGSAPKR
jgi:hypothetical protein